MREAWQMIQGGARLGTICSKLIVCQVFSHHQERQHPEGQATELTYLDVTHNYTARPPACLPACQGRHKILNLIKGSVSARPGLSSAARACVAFNYVPGPLQDKLHGQRRQVGHSHRDTATQNTSSIIRCCLTHLPEQLGAYDASPRH